MCFETRSALRSRRRLPHKLDPDSPRARAIELNQEDRLQGEEADQKSEFESR
jgi:hypothetical protein